jgi:protein-S-isoprenylcysteine O-methyltransferase Ste14
VRWRLAKAILLLPANVVLVIPALLAWAAAGTAGAASPPRPDDWAAWAGLGLFAAGLALSAWTVRLFAATGSGTPAPWDPVSELVVAGPYRHCRNPMITGVIAMLGGEALAFRSPALAAWCAAFSLANALYLPLVEEPGLVRRHGAAYERYRRSVPRWLPRWRPWPGARPG